VIALSLLSSTFSGTFLRRSESFNCRQNTRTEGRYFRNFVSLLLNFIDVEMPLMSKEDTLCTDPNCQIGISRSV